MIMVAYCVGWWLIASVLLWLTWNRVVAALTKVKPAKFWQAALLLLTVCSLCAPLYWARKHSCGHGGGGNEPCAYEKPVSK